MSETTSAGAIGLDLEVNAKLDKDVQVQAKKIAESIQKALSGMDTNVFKQLHEGVAKAMQAMVATIRNQTAQAQALMKAFVESMSTMMNGFNVKQIFPSSEDEPAPTNASTSTAHTRAPPSIKLPKITMPKLKLDDQFNTDSMKLKIQELEAELDSLDDHILNLQQRRKMLLETYSDSMSAKDENSLNLKVMNIDQQIAKFQIRAESANLTIQGLQRQLQSLNTSSVKEMPIPKFPKLTAPLSQLKMMPGIVGKIGVAFKLLKGNISTVISGAVQFATVMKQKFASVVSSVKRAISAVSKLGKTLSTLARIGMNPLSMLKKGFDKLTGSMNKSSKSAGHAGMGIGRLAKSFVVFSLIFPIVSRAVMSLGQSISASLKTNETFTNSLNQIKTNLMAAFMPIYQAILPALNALMSALAKITAMFAGFISNLFGKTYSQSVQAAQGLVDAKDAMGAYGNAAKETAKKLGSLAGMDEINTLNSQSDNGSNGGGGSAPVITPTDFDESSVSDFAKKLRELFDKGDFTGIGKLLGEKINASVLKMTDYISWDKVGGKITETINHITDLFNSLVGTINWENIGRLLGTGINTISNTLYTLMKGINWAQCGTALANGVNGIVYSVDWPQLGRTIGSFFQAQISLMHGYVTTADYPAIGKALADCLTGLGNEIDWNQLAETLGKGISGAISLIHNFVKNIDWRELGYTIGSSINTFFANVNWADLGATLSDAALGLLDTLRAALASIDWGQIGKALADFLCNIDWISLLIDLAVVIGQAFIGLTGTIVEFIKELADNIITGFFNGLLEFFGDPLGWIKDHIVDPFINAIKDLFGIHSPSTVMLEIGGNLIQGMINGIGGLIGTLVGSVGSWFGGIADTISNTWDSIKETAGNAWDGITSTIGDAWEGLKKGASDTWENLKSGVSSTWENIKQGAGNAWEGIKSGIGGFVGDIGSNISNGFNTAKDLALGSSNVLKTDVLSNFNSMSSEIGQLPGKLSSIGSDMFNRMRDGVNSTIGNVKSAISSGMDNATTDMKSLSGSSSTWGSDMISGFEQGIRSKMSSVVSAARNVASSISSLLHFSRPDEGPLRNYETWMPDMIDGLKRTLESRAPALISGVQNIAQAMSNAMALDTPDIAFAGHREIDLSTTIQHDNQETIDKQDTIITYLGLILEVLSKDEDKMMHLQVLLGNSVLKDELIRMNKESIAQTGKPLF